MRHSRERSAEEVAERLARWPSRRTSSPGVQFDMTTSLHQQCRASLQAERAELQHTIEIIGTRDALRREDLDDDEVVEMLNQTLNEIEDALFRLSNGTFGICDLCKAIISAERLAELPSARHCLDCAEAESSVIIASCDVE
jgi:RNA polymerase-binding transcription factor DksA